MSRSRMSTYVSAFTSTSALSSGSNSTRSPTSTVRTCGPTAATRDQASRRPPIAAVAGITMPPVERRSPASESTETRTRSWSMRIGVLSATDPSHRLLREAAYDDHEDHEPDDGAAHLEDVVGARVAVRVHEVRLQPGDLPTNDRLRAGPVGELVDRRGQPLAGRLDVVLDRGGRGLLPGRVGLGHGVLLAVRAGPARMPAELPGRCLTKVTRRRRRRQRRSG